MKSQKDFITQIVIVLIAVIIVGGVIYAKNQKATPLKEFETELNIGVSTTSVTSSIYFNTNQNPNDPEVVSTENWKTYTNDDKHYRIKYPPSWKIQEGQNSSVRIFNGTESVTVVFNAAVCNMTDWATSTVRLIHFVKNFCMDKEEGNLIVLSANEQKSKKIEELILDSFELLKVKTSDPLTLFSQNDGEIYNTGSTTEILFSGVNIKNPNRIYLETYKNNQLFIEGSISTTTLLLNGKLSWIVGDIYDIESGKKLPFESKLTSYLIRIEDIKTGSFVRSRVPFTIVN